MYYLSIVIIIASSIFYHLSQKSISGGLNPLISLIVTYSTALVLSVLLLFVFPFERNGLASQLTSINWASYLLGFSIVGLELGFLLAYRAGWNISQTAIFATVLVTLILIPIGIWLFKDKLSLVNTLGILLSVIGIYMINR